MLLLPTQRVTALPSRTRRRRCWSSGCDVSHTTPADSTGRSSHPATTPGCDPPDSPVACDPATDRLGTWRGTSSAADPAAVYIRARANLAGGCRTRPLCVCVHRSAFRCERVPHIRRADRASVRYEASGLSLLTCVSKGLAATAARTIAAMPILTGSGSAGQAATMAFKSSSGLRVLGDLLGSAMVRRKCLSLR